MIEDWLTENGVEPEKLELTGNSISFDKGFLYEHMPRVLDWFHYRIVDISTLKVLARKWNTPLAKYLEESRPKSTSTHRALPDLYDSIFELKFYRESLLRTVDAS
jgi:oligoribonuclease